MSSPHSYPWHDGHTHHHRLAKAANEHPHMDGPPVAPGTPQVNDQAAGKGVATYAGIARHYGDIAPGTKTDLFHYDYHGKLPAVQDLVKRHGFQVYYAGGQFGKPDLANRNYNTRHLMIYDPTPSSGGDFGDRDYTDAWRQTHELAHGLVYPELNRIYGEGRRIGKLGVHRTAHEAARAVHWEWLAAHKQRELNAQIGIHVPDEVFHKELNTVMHDAVHRAITGKFTEPSDEGFVPSPHKVPLETSLGLVQDAARNLGLQHPHQVLRKSRDSMATQHPQIQALRQGLRAQLVKALRDLEPHYEALRARELAKSEKACKSCGKAHEELAKCGDMAEVKKDETRMSLRDRETVPTSRAVPDKPHDDASLPGDGAPKDVTPAKQGSGGEVEKIRGRARTKGRLAKSDVPDPADTPVPPAAAQSTPTSAPAASSTGAPQQLDEPHPDTQRLQHLRNSPLRRMALAAMHGSERPEQLHSDIRDLRAYVEHVELMLGGGGVSKADVPMAKPPSGKSPTPSAPPTSAPKAAGAPAAPAASSTGAPKLDKASLRLGGRTDASRDMTSHAFAAGAPAAGKTSTIPTGRPKADPEAQARRAAELAAFTPAGAFQESHNQGAAAGAMSHPSAAPASSGLELARPPRSTIPTGRPK